MDFLTNPFIVVLLFLYRLLGENLVIAIIGFTIITRMATYPLTVSQMRSTKEMQKLQPLLKVLREKYKGDREKLAQAQMELYREHKINPFAGCLPLLIQMPILFGLYGAIYAMLAATPLQLLDVQTRLLVPGLSDMIPLNNQFLWLNLGLPDPFFILPALVVASTWLQSKLMTPTPTDPKDPSYAVSRQMTIMMPLMVGLFSLQFASGLSIYWVVSNVVGIAQYAMMGRIDWRNLRAKAPETVEIPPELQRELKEIEEREKKAEAARKAKTLTPAGAGDKPAASPKLVVQPTQRQRVTTAETINRKRKPTTTSARKAKPTK